MTIEGPMATIIGSVLGALIVGGVALLIWGISTLLRFHDRLVKVDASQENLAEDVAELKVGQAKLAEEQAKLAVEQAKQAVDLAQLKAGQDEILRRLDALSS